MKPVSLLDASVQVRLIWLALAAVAVNPVGAAGFATPSCTVALGRGTSPRVPHWVPYDMPVRLLITHHVPVEGRHTAKSVLPSPS